MQLVTVENETEVVARLWQHIEHYANSAISERNVFRIGLSGGSLIKYMSMGASTARTDWPKWKLFFCDERYVPEESEDSTFGQYKREFVTKTGLKMSQFSTIDSTLELADCAHAYEQELYKQFDIQDLDFKSIPRFDLLLLGMGPDGHTCSLFPDHRLLSVDQVLIAPIDDSPKPPPKRVTMTYSLINNAKVCLFAMSGQGKAEMIKRIIKDKEPLPAGLVKPTNGELYWIVDKAAASLL